MVTNAIFPFCRDYLLTISTTWICVWAHQAGEHILQDFIKMIHLNRHGPRRQRTQTLYGPFQELQKTFEIYVGNNIVDVDTILLFFFSFLCVTHSIKWSWRIRDNAIGVSVEWCFLWCLLYHQSSVFLVCLYLIYHCILVARLFEWCCLVVIYLHDRTILIAASWCNLQYRCNSSSLP
jgi:hypothetical protein